MDENKWIDNVLCLHESAKVILLGLHGFKQTLVNTQKTRDLRIGNIIFKTAGIQDLKFKRIGILVDSGYASLRKVILKSFPILLDLNLNYSQIHDWEDLKSVFELIIASLDFIDGSNICFQQSTKFIKFSVIYSNNL